MVKLIKHIELNRPKKVTAAKNNDPTKGTPESPYTVDEYLQLWFDNEQCGGYVEGFGLIDEFGNLIDSWGSDDSFSSFSSFPFDDEENENEPEEHEGNGSNQNNEENNSDGNNEKEQQNSNNNGENGGGVHNEGDNGVGDNDDSTVPSATHHIYTFTNEYPEFEEWNRLNIEATPELEYDTIVYKKKTYIFNGLLSAPEYIDITYSDAKNITHHTKFMILSGATWGLYKFLTDAYRVEWLAVYNGEGNNPSDDTPCTIITLYDTTCCNIDVPPSGFVNAVHSHPLGGSRSPEDLVSAAIFEKFGYRFLGIYDIHTERIEKYWEKK